MEQSKLLMKKPEGVGMPQRASQRKLGKGMKTHLAKQRNRSWRKHEIDVCRRESV